MAQNLIEHNPDRAKPPLAPRDLNPPGVIHNVIFRTMEDESEGLAQFIHSKIESREVEPGEVLVLANWRVIAYRIRDRLIAMGHEAHSYFSEEPLDTPEARQALALLTLVANPEDRVALRSFISLNSPNEERAAYRRIFDYAVENGLSALEVLNRLSDGSIEIPYTTRAVNIYNDLKTILTELVDLANDIPELVNHVCPAGEGSTLALRQVIERILLDPEAIANVSSFVAELRTHIGVPDVPLEAQFVRLMSLHKSKGLTVKLVVIAGLVEGLVPRNPKDNLQGAALDEYQQEQRRILYVGITRPTLELVLSRFQEIETHDAHVSGAVRGQWIGHGVSRTISSTLLRELGPELPAVIRADMWDY